MKPEILSLLKIVLLVTIGVEVAKGMVVLIVGVVGAAICALDLVDVGFPFA